MKITIRNEDAEPVIFPVPAEQAGKRLDSAAAELAGLTRSVAAKLIEEGNITVNGTVVSKNARLCGGDTVEVFFPEPEPCDAIPQEIPLDVVYEDEDVIVVNKPQGMVVHPAAGNPDGTLVNALLFRCGGSLSGIGGVVRPGIVHRIDKDTSGLLVVAKNDAAHLALAGAIKEHLVRRVYFAVAVGNFRDDSGTVNAPVGRHPTDRKRMAVLRGEGVRAREAITHWQVLGRGEADGMPFTLLRCELETGRTHQIRVHMASLGHPLLGDPVYGGDKTRFEAHHRDLIHGQCLHAGELRFSHPRDGREIFCRAEPPQSFCRTVEILFGTDAVKQLPAPPKNE